MTGRPTQDRCTILSKRSEILLPNVVCRIQIGIELIATAATVKNGLRTPVIARLIATPGAGLRRVPGVNLDHGYPTRFGFVGEKAVKLLKTPTVQAALSFTLSQLGALPNMGEVLHHDGTARGGMGDDALTQHVIMIFALPKPFARELAQMAFRAPGAFGLQLSAETEETAFLLFPVAASQELPCK